MNSGSLIAWHYRTYQPVEVRWRDGIITQIQSASVAPPDSVWIAPGLLDLQVNGYGGIDFQQDQLTGADLQTAARGLRLAGCTRFFLTLVTDEWSQLLRRLRHLRALRLESDELCQAIAGWHIEGPFLSAAPGYCGAHNPEMMCDPTPEMIRDLREAAGEGPLLLTLAPERSGALAAIAQAASVGITVSLGHTNAPVEILRRAVEAGATGFTHLGNACPRELDRHDNILWRVLETRGLLVSLIPDAIHVSPPFFRIAHRLLETNSVCYTTDAMSAAGAPPGHYRLGRMELEVGQDQIVRQPGRTNFAGSALRPIDGVLRAAEMLGCGWREVWDRSSTIPGAWLGLPQGLSTGEAANFCVINCDAAAKFERLRVFWQGQEMVS